MSQCEFDHRPDIIDSDVFVVGPVVLCYIVGAAVNDYDARFKIDDILPESSEHLTRHLSADASADQILADKETRMSLFPEFGDGIAHEHDTHGVGLSRH